MVIRIKIRYLCIFLLLIVGISGFYIYSDLQKPTKSLVILDILEPPKDGTYIYGGAIYTISRQDSNDDWVTATNGGRYKYRVDCSNCGECWHVSATECYMISESWEKKQVEVRKH